MDYRDDEVGDAGDALATLRLLWVPVQRAVAGHPMAGPYYGRVCDLLGLPAEVRDG